MVCSLIIATLLIYLMNALDCELRCVFKKQKMYNTGRAISIDLLQALELWV